MAGGGEGMYCQEDSCCCVATSNGDRASTKTAEWMQTDETKPPDLPSQLGRESPARHRTPEALLT